MAAAAGALGSVRGAPDGILGPAGGHLRTGQEMTGRAVCRLPRCAITGEVLRARCRTGKRQHAVGACRLENETAGLHVRPAGGLVGQVAAFLPRFECNERIPYPIPFCTRTRNVGLWAVAPLHLPNQFSGKLCDKLLGQRVHSARLVHCLLVTMRPFQPPQPSTHYRTTLLLPPPN